MNALRVACRTRSTLPSSPSLLFASSSTCRPALARPSLARLASSQVCKAKVRSLADIQADQMDILARSAGTRWRSTTEPGELQEMTIFARPAGLPIPLILCAVIGLTCCFVATGNLQQAVQDREAYLEERARAPESFVAPSTLPSTCYQLSLPFNLGSIPIYSSNWAITYTILAAVPPFAAVYFGKRAGARIVKYKPSGRLRVFTRLDDVLKSNGTLIDFGIAEGELRHGGTREQARKIVVHLPPKGFSTSSFHSTTPPRSIFSTLRSAFLPFLPKDDGLNFPTVNLDMVPPDTSDVARAREEGREIVVSQGLVDKAFGGISFRVPSKAEKEVQRRRGGSS